MFLVANTLYPHLEVKSVFQYTENVSQTETNCKGKERCQEAWGEGKLSLVVQESQHYSTKALLQQGDEAIF